MTHKDLDVWKRSIELVTKIYKISESFPEEEKFGIINQMRRSAVSVPSNIAEGASRGGTNEYIRFLNIASASLSELDTQLVISIKLGFCLEDNVPLDDLEIISKMLYKLKKSLDKRRNS